jgi:hypothetical protein
MESTQSISEYTNQVANSFDKVGVTFEQALNTLRIQKATNLPRYIDDHTVKKIDTVASAVLFCSALASYFIYSALAEKHGALVSTGQNRYTYYPNHFMGGISAGSFLIAICMTLFFVKIVASKIDIRNRDEKIEVEEIEELENLLLEDINYDRSTARVVEVPPKYIPKLFSRLSYDHRRALSFQQLRGLHDENADLLESALKNHELASLEEAKWNKMQLFVSISHANSQYATTDAPKEPSSKDPLLPKLAAKTLVPKADRKRLLAAFCNSLNQPFLHDPQFIETLIHKLYFDEDDHELLEILARHLAQANAIEDENLPWDEIVIAMKNLRCSLDRAKKLVKPKAELKIDIIFRLDDGNKVFTNRALLCQHSQVFATMLCSPRYKDPFSRNGEEEYVDLLGVDKDTFELLIDFLEGKCNDPKLSDPAGLYALATLADGYGFLSIMNSIEEILISSLSKLDLNTKEELLSAIELAKQFNFKNLLRYLDQQFCVQMCRKAEPFSRGFAKRLTFSVDHHLYKSQQQLRTLFKKAVAELIYKPGSLEEIAIESLLATLVDLGSHSQEAIYPIWDLLYPLFEQHPEFLKLLWSRAEAMLEPHLQMKICQFFKEDRAVPIWIASFATAPRSKHELTKVI